MSQDKSNWTPLRPSAEDSTRVAGDVAPITEIQQKLLKKDSHLKCPDRVAHQYQIAGGKVRLRVAAQLPGPLQGVGLFQPGAEYIGIGRVSTGMGTPHIETNPDFLGLMFAFQTAGGQRVDFLGINDPTSPTDHHQQFIHVLDASAESAGVELPVAGKWGEYDLGDLAAQQLRFGFELTKRLGVHHGPKTLLHLVGQSLRACRSSTAYQTYWTGIEETGGIAGKFTMVPVRDENHHPEFRPGERHLSEEWRKRQAAGDIEFRLYWIPYIDEDSTPTDALTKPWEEDHKLLAASVSFPKTDRGDAEARLWAILASEMGANHGNWVHDKDNSVAEPATEFGLARKLAYQNSQRGRGVLEPHRYASVFSTGQIGPELAEELNKRHSAKDQAGHMGWDPSS